MLSESPNLTERNISKKIVLKELLCTIKKKKEINYKKWKKLKKISAILRPLFTGFNAVSVSSIVLTFSPFAPIFIIIALTSASISTVGTVIIDAYQLENKIARCHNSYRQYADLYRTVSASMNKKHLTSDDYDDILEDLNNMISLIEDSEI
jgi:hypothetical protein